MTAYLIRRILTSLIVVLGVSLFIYYLLHKIYPSPAQDILGAKATHTAVLDWNRIHGFDRPFIEQYLTYMNHLIHGDLGHSYKVNQSVAALFGQRWMRSAYLSGMSLLLAVLIAIPLG
ncbi:MAG: ABC transporter permease, partial [Nocardiopsaceae bacterium]|nr:ABC transporter permease [Nocardiopsaceae bacterium]